MIIVINNSNRNIKIKNYCKVIQPEKLKLETSSNAHNAMFPLYVTDTLLKKLRELKIPHINIVSLSELILIIQNNINVTGVIISGSAIKLSLGNVPDDLLLPSLLAIETFKNQPIFGICFGFQIINYFFGGQITGMDKFVKDDIIVNFQSNTNKSKKSIFSSAYSGKYRFLHGDHITRVSPQLSIIAKDNNGVIQAIEHRNLSISGVQFHPEMSGVKGETLIKEFIKQCGYL